MEEFRMRVNIVAVALLLMTICFIKCKKNDPAGDGGSAQIPGPVDVYITGSESDATGSKGVAEYWKNGVVTKLTDGKNNASAQAMAISGNDIYVVGFETINNKNIIKYWKNGVAVSVTDGTHSAYAYNIAVNGNDVYVCGYERDDNGNDIAKYWKNGVATILAHANPADEAEATSIKISGNDVYVAGNIGSQTYNAVLWKNGVLTNLATVGNSIANTMLISNNNVYVAGADGQSDSPEQSYATYWMNGNKTRSTNTAGIVYGEAYGIAVSGSDVYLAGYTENTSSNKFATYWKNGSPVNLTDGTHGAQAWGIAVNGSDVYVVGYEAKAPNNAAAPKYWKNGVAVDLASSTTNSYAGGATSIMLKAQ